MKERNYLVTFNFKKELDKSIMVQKKTKKIDKVFYIPKSIIIESEKYIQEKSLWKDVKYERVRIAVLLPKWYCDKELGFYI
jgi:hypothetical protein